LSTTGRIRRGEHVGQAGILPAVPTLSENSGPYST